MQFNIATIVAAVLVTAAVANPMAEVRDTSSADYFLTVGGIPLSHEVSANCVLDCASVVESAVCIAKAIKAKKTKDLLKCAAKAKICDCGECVPDLKEYLANNSIC
ncbi:hypothetical protein G7Y89_g11774 [Cudoniella acicularis]|uniref:Fungal calcium binding protein domain-containing protein n=1 Tax=Cudoniella acicularis TaxID=354080 RepID=A0A8H4RA84_9HELO|nr:hypothetical protein G7Y89_g11774 [Cudoniella acicularis]